MVFFHTPGSKDMKAFKVKIKDGTPDIPLFGSNQPVVVKIKFFMRRLNTHFKGKDRLNPLRTGLPFAHTSVPDLNNLAKFA